MAALNRWHPNNVVMTCNCGRSHEWQNRRYLVCPCGRIHQKHDSEEAWEIDVYGRPLTDAERAVPDDAARWAVVKGMRRL